MTFRRGGGGIAYRFVAAVRVVVVGLVQAAARRAEDMGRRGMVVCVMGGVGCARAAAGAVWDKSWVEIV